MRYNELWRKLHDGGYTEGEAKAVTRMLLADKYGMTTADMICEDIVKFTDADNLYADVEALIAFTPVQYVVGKAWFCDRQFIVRPGCLIPRPDTSAKGSTHPTTTLLTCSLTIRSAQGGVLP